MEISFEAWEGVQRHGQDLADRLAQGFTGLLQAPPQFPWPPAPHKRMPFDIDLPVVPFGAGVPKKDLPFPAAAAVSSSSTSAAGWARPAPSLGRP
ncbi:hypothetical protein Zm00014a_024753 [Zea mays]|uniref:Uncharacterized protein n=1 Tax=Zea mays TaxID=4577 RepID=A0A3L6FLM1_MAIZE|nr:hypothetical protein Zm00014a_024753 [Zea mays]